MQKTKATYGTMFLFGVRIDNIDFDSAFDAVCRYFTREPAGGPRQVFFTNAHTIHLARRDAEFRAIVNRADAVLPDGSGLKFAGRMLNKPIIANLNGTDFTPRVIGEASTKGWTIYLMGGRQGVAERCRAFLQQKFPGVSIVGVHHGHFVQEEEEGIIEDINRKGPDMLLVAMGSPLQEKWIAQNAHRLKVKACFAVGGLFDFPSGERKRAPHWMRRIGVEWIFRFFQDPKSKWNRIVIEIPLFVALVLAKRLIPHALQQFISKWRVAV